MARCTKSAATAESTPPLRRAQHLGLPHLCPDRRDLIVDDVGRRPIGQQTAPLVQEPLHHVLAVRGVRDLRMELHGVQSSLRVFHGGDRDLVGASRDPEAFGLPRHRVAVRHPHGVAGREVLEATANLLPLQALSRRTRVVPSPRPRRRGPGPSAGVRSRCRAPAPRVRTARGRPADHPRHRPTTAHR